MQENLSDEKKNVHEMDPWFVFFYHDELRKSDVNYS